METIIQNTMKTIYILWLRQIKRYVRSKSRMIGSLAQPVLFLLSLGYGFGSVFQKAGQGNYIEFLAPGIIGMGIIFSAVFSGIEIIWDKQFGFLKETLVAPVSRFSIMLGRTIGGATVATFQGTLVLLVSLLAGFHPTNWLFILPLLVAMFLVALVFSALGTMIGSLLNDMQGFQLIVNFLIMPLFFLSGALFPLTNLPAVMNIVVRLDPLSYGVDAFRGLLIGVTHFGLAMDMSVLLGFALVFVTLGSYSFSKVQI